MTDVRRLLHPTDFSDAARSALRYAITAANRLDAELYVVHVTRAAARDGEPDPMHVAESQLKSRMRHAVSEASTDALPQVEYCLIRGASAADGIVRFVEEHDIDAVIMGTHGRRGFRRFILGSVTAHVLHEATCDVVVVPKNAEGEGPGRILVPVDLFGRSQELASWSMELAAQLGTGVDVLYVIDTSLLMMPTLANREMPLARIETIEEVVHRRLRGLVMNAPKGVDVATHVREGHPAREILRFAEHGSSTFVVLASSGMTPSERALMSSRDVHADTKYMLGSITERVATNAAVPVWVRKRFENERLVPRTDVHELELTAS